MSDKVALVTGVIEGGIGYEAARMLAARGVRMMLVDINPRVHETARVIGISSDARAHIADLEKPDELDAAVSSALSAFGRIDILVNNAGYHPKDQSGYKYTVLDTDLEFWQKSLMINLTAPYLLVKKVLPGMIERRFGRIINVASRAGRTGSAGAAAAYSAAKAGLIGFTRAVALETASYNVTVNCVAPGPVLTPITTPSEEARAMVIRSIPLGRYGRPDEIASSIDYLATDHASFITGAVIDANGGSFMG